MQMERTLARILGHLNAPCCYIPVNPKDSNDPGR